MTGWLENWLRRGIRLTLPLPKFLDASNDKCRFCKKTRSEHIQTIHRFRED